MECHEIVHNEKSSTSFDKRAETSLAWDIFEILSIDSHGKEEQSVVCVEKFFVQRSSVAQI